MRKFVNKGEIKMKRMLIIIFGITVSFALNAEVRYLADDGDDAADGRTSTSAWRTIKKANAALSRGATLKLKCGDVFYGALRPPAGVDAEHPTVITSWGEGPKPVISATKNLKCDPSIVDGDVKPWKRYDHNDLVSPWDFCGEDGWLCAR